MEILVKPSRANARNNARNPGGAYVEDLIAVLSGVFEALAANAKGDTEIVLHDLRRPERSVIKIVNGHISGRNVGHAMVTGPSGADGVRKAHLAIGAPKEIRVLQKFNTSAGGRPLRSSSTIYFDEQGVAAAILCLNTDTAIVERIQNDLLSLIAPMPAAAPDVLESRETKMEDLVSEIIETAIGGVGIAVERMTKAEKVAAVATMHQRGLFLMRGSVDLAARRLGTTKFTIYNYLEELGVKRS